MTGLWGRKGRRKGSDDGDSGAVEPVVIGRGERTAVTMAVAAREEMSVST